MRLLILLSVALSFLFTLAPTASAASKKQPKFPVPSGQFTGGYVTNGGDEGNLSIFIDSRGRLTGTGETWDGTTFTLKGTVTVNQKTGRATGKVTFNGRDDRGSATIRIEDNALTGTYRGKSGRRAETGTYSLQRR